MSRDGVETDGASVLVMFGPGRDEHRLRGLSWFLMNT